MAGQRPSWYFQAVSRGVVGSAMPRWDHALSDADRWDVALFAWSLVDTPEVLDRGRDAYAAACEACHGPDGRREPLARLDDPVRVGSTRSEAERRLYEAHKGADLESLAADEVRDASAYGWTFLYEPAP
jgi:mono/diheme cytochrome c family protein